jgi:hypothetical protein
MINADSMDRVRIILNVAPPELEGLEISVFYKYIAPPFDKPGNTGA